MHISNYKYPQNYRVLAIDETRPIEKSVPKLNGGRTNSFLYRAVIEAATEPVPQISEKYDINTIAYWLGEFLKDVPVPNEAVLEFSLALLNVPLRECDGKDNEGNNIMSEKEEQMLFRRMKTFTTDEFDHYEKEYDSDNEDGSIRFTKNNYFAMYSFSVNQSILFVTARVEGYSDLKTLIGGENYRPMRVDKFIGKHIRIIENSSKLERTLVKEIQKRYEKIERKRRKTNCPKLEKHWRGKNLLERVLLDIDEEINETIDIKNEEMVECHKDNSRR
ncbi:hypothetical protein HHI36_014765 [Cryptolaemus montrouzieri]|uniref:Uncharacterized protein n=1 Tax=Cryptolaemus montrouzieri TaxID=559131 RepID=A0ABD2N3P2_9CUCU